MADRRVNASGMHQGQLLRTLTTTLSGMPSGDVLEVVTDSPSFEFVLRKWCTQKRVKLTAVSRRGDWIWAQICQI